MEVITAVLGEPIFKTSLFSSGSDMMNLATDMVGMALLAVIASFLACILIVITEGWHGNHSFDNDMTGAQKFHKKPVPRAGGLALLAGILVAIVFGMPDEGTSASRGQAANFSGLLLLLAAMPAFLAGLLEDLTKRVSVTLRLVATFASALLASWLLDATLPRLDIWGFDFFLRITPVAMVITAIAVAGVANAINIIDGFNGLAATAAVIILAGLGLVAWHAGDVFVARLAILGIGAVVGFLFLNYPTGRLFMGDGGAYLLGFWIAEIAVLTIVRNPSVNAWQMLAICAYPIIEVLFSIYRRKVVKRTSVGAPDHLHLHSLVYRRMVSRLLPRNDEQPWIRNATVACIISICVAPAMLLAVFLGDTIIGALTIISIQIFSYLSFYARLVRGHWCFHPAVVFGLRPEHRAKSL